MKKNAWVEYWKRVHKAYCVEGFAGTIREPLLAGAYHSGRRASIRSRPSAYGRVSCRGDSIANQAAKPVVKKLKPPLL